MRKSVIEKLERIGTCEEGLKWISSQSSIEEAWKKCVRGDWLLWYIAKTIKVKHGPAHKKLVLCCCKVARQAIKHVEKGEKRPLNAIQKVENWAKNKGATLEEVRLAAAAAYAAAANTAAANANANAAYATAHAHYAAADAAAEAADAADAAAEAAYSAYSAADAEAGYSAYSAADAAYSAYSDAYSSSFFASLKKAADIVREFYPNAPRMRGKKKWEAKS